MSVVRAAYVLKMFPRFSETFVANEILELERRGLPLVIYSLKRPAPGPRHAMLGRLRSEVVYLPDSLWRAAPALLSAHARLLVRAPGRYLRTFGYVLTRHSWAALKRFLQAGVLVLDAEARGVLHLHAHFATSATRVAMLAARLSPVTYSFTAHAKDIYLDRQDVDLLRDKLVEARFTVTVSDFNHAHLERLCGADAVRRVVRIYNGVDLSAFDGMAAARTPGSIVCVARLVEKKGVSDLLEACARLRERGVSFTCRIVGDGPLRGALEHRGQALELGGAVRFTGALPHEEVVRELGRAQVLALPCVVAADGNRDGLPTVILEAMASGTAVVSTRVTGIPEMVEHGVSGLLVEPGQPEALAGALALLLADPASCRRLGEAGRRRVERRFALRQNAGALYARLAETLAEAAAVARPAAPRPAGLRVGRAPEPRGAEGR